MKDVRSRYFTVSFGLLALALLAFAVVLIRTAWVNDDAYITFRTVDNFLHGYGLRWNVNERVQAYTNPLWMFLISAVTVFTREYYLTVIGVSVVVSLGAVGLLAFGVARSRGLAILAVTALISARAFVDYSTSGLENPLTHLLLVAFAVVFFRVQWTSRTLVLLSLLAALAMLNRMDTILFFAPALVYVWCSERSLRATLLLAAGFAPFVAWEFFSLVYYGFLVPNTAFAKLGTGIDGGLMIRQGLSYYRYTIEHDPVTLPLVALGVFAAFASRRGRDAALAAGLVLYLVYIVKIGGDFMGGRFFATPVFLAALLLSRSGGLAPAWRAVPVAAVVLWVAALNPYAPFRTGAEFGASAKGFKDASGVGDERLFYYNTCGLLQWRPGRAMPAHGFANAGRAYAALGKPVSKVHGAIGFRGFFAGPLAHIVDYYALADPLLARLPAYYKPNWRIGHFSRDVPKRYLESSTTGVNTLTDPMLGKYFDDLVLATRGPLWTVARWQAIWRLNTGRDESYIDVDRYRFPSLLRLNAKDVSRRKEAGLKADAKGLKRFKSGGVGVAFAGTQHARDIEVSLLDQQAYRLLVMRGGVIAGDYALPAEEHPSRRLVVRTITLPPGVAAAGYSEVRFIPLSGKGDHLLGHLRLLSE